MTKWMIFDTPKNRARGTLEMRPVLPVSLGKVADTPQFNDRPETRAELGWVAGYRVKAVADIVKSGSEFGFCVSVVVRPDHVDPYAVYVSAATYARRDDSHGRRTEPRFVATFGAWDDAMKLLLELSA